MPGARADNGRPTGAGARARRDAGGINLPSARTSTRAFSLSPSRPCGGAVSPAGGAGGGGADMGNRSRRSVEQRSPTLARCVGGGASVARPGRGRRAGAESAHAACRHSCMAFPAALIPPHAASAGSGRAHLPATAGDDRVGDCVRVAVTPADGGAGGEGRGGGWGGAVNVAWVLDNVGALCPRRRPQCAWAAPTAPPFFPLAVFLCWADALHPAHDSHTALIDPRVALKGVPGDLQGKPLTARAAKAAARVPTAAAVTLGGASAVSDAGLAAVLVGLPLQAGATVDAGGTTLSVAATTPSGVVRVGPRTRLLRA